MRPIGLHHLAVEHRDRGLAARCPLLAIEAQQIGSLAGAQLDLDVRCENLVEHVQVSICWDYLP